MQHTFICILLTLNLSLQAMGISGYLHEMQEQRSEQAGRDLKHHDHSTCLTCQLLRAPVDRPGDGHVDLASSTWHELPPVASESVLCAAVVLPISCRGPPAC